MINHHLINKRKVKQSIGSAETKCVTCLEIIGVVNNVMTIYDRLTKNPGNSDSDVKQQFNDIQQQLFQMSSELNAIISLIIDQGSRNQYSWAEVIYHSRQSG